MKTILSIMGATRALGLRCFCAAPLKPAAVLRRKRELHRYYGITAVLGRVLIAPLKVASSGNTAGRFVGAPLDRAQSLPRTRQIIRPLQPRKCAAAIGTAGRPWRVFLLTISY